MILWLPYNNNHKSNHYQWILLLTLLYTALLMMLSLHSSSLDNHKVCMLVLCAKLSTSAWVPVSPSGFPHSHSSVSDELALMPSASWHAASSPILQYSNHSPVRLWVLLRSSAVEGNTHSCNIVIQSNCIRIYLSGANIIGDVKTMVIQYS